jgi:hypothetical protein
MKSFNLFLENNWMSTYTLSDQIWLSDSLNWEKTSTLATFDWSIFSFVFQSSFLSNYMFNDFIVKLSTLDAMLIHLNMHIRTPQFLYDSFVYDIILFLNLYYLPFSTLILSGYQEHISSVLILSPELFFLFTEYINSFILYNVINNNSVFSIKFNIWLFKKSYCLTYSNLYYNIKYIKLQAVLDFISSSIVIFSLL